MARTIPSVPMILTIRFMLQANAARLISVLTFFALVLTHVAGALHHAWVRRDVVFEAMTARQ